MSKRRNEYFYNFNLAAFLLFIVFVYSYGCFHLISSLNVIDGYSIFASFVGYVSIFLYILYDSMNTDIILCYIGIEGALLAVIVLYGLVGYLYFDLRFVIFCIFLISIAACEVAIGLGLLVRYK